MLIFENNLIKIEKEDAVIPWLKIFTQTPYKELSDCPNTLRLYLYEVTHIIEKEMLNYYQPDKINIASFANILPRVHIHVQARFKQDPWFPNPTWGELQRQSQLNLADFDPFSKTIQQQLKLLSI